MQPGFADATLPVPQAECILAFARMTARNWGVGSQNIDHKKGGAVACAAFRILEAGSA